MTEDKHSPDSVAGRLTERLGKDVDPEISLPEEESGSDYASESIRRLSGRGEAFGRYDLRGELAHGGQGSILRVWDEDLRRTLAMKVVRGKQAGSSSEAEEVDSRTLGRFLEEAQITGQLEHPGVVPVHELGLDDEGRVYFTMKLVRGQTLKRVFDLVRDQQQGWTRARALGAFLKVCEATAYAHSKGVIHRDLKPANVMVGRFGQVYVMDWGLARVQGARDTRDIRVLPEQQTTTLRSERHESPDSPLITMDGDVVGTPSYMSPEQAKGQLESMGPWSDVYSAGAMLYHLLSGNAPYVPLDGIRNSFAVWQRVQEGPPRTLQQLAPGAPAELVAICEKAMARDASQRYRDMEELAVDIRAFLEERVVRAYEAGAGAELRKWVRRNKRWAATLAAVVVVLLVATGAGFFGVAQARALDTERELRSVAEQNEEKALALQAVAQAERARILQLSAIIELQDLEAEADTLWPARPDRIEAYEAWLARAEVLVAELGSKEERGGYYGLLAELQARGTTDEAGALAFANVEDAWWHDQLARLIADLERLGDEDTGSIRDVWQRLEFAQRLHDSTITQHLDAWEATAGAIARDPLYRGLRLEPQLGLVPLGQDPGSGLWEFADAQTGKLPGRDATGWLALDEDTALVFVLVPGSAFLMGSQGEGRHLPNYDPDSERAYEYPVHEVELEAFFLSKYEMTQGQWSRFFGSNPSEYHAGRTNYKRRPAHVINLANPVESVSFANCSDAMAKLGFALPTEAQWEYAARAGTDTPWWTGDAKESLAGAANLADAFARAGSGVYRSYEEWLDDGFEYHAPVGSFDPNPFGLHDVHGNVWEWTADPSGDYGRYDTRAGDGLRQVPEHLQSLNVMRGGSYQDNAVGVRSARRGVLGGDFGAGVIGLRPARALDPAVR